MFPGQTLGCGVLFLFWCWRGKVKIPPVHPPSLGVVSMQTPLQCRHAFPSRARRHGEGAFTADPSAPPQIWRRPASVTAHPPALGTACTYARRQRTHRSAWPPSGRPFLFCCFIIRYLFDVGVGFLSYCFVFS